MEVLLKSDNNLTKEEILWAASNLPDGESIGEHALNDNDYNHDADSIFDSLCIDKKDAQKVAKIFSSATTKIIMPKDSTGKYTISNAVEEVISEGRKVPGFDKLIVSKMIHQAVEELAGLLKDSIK